MGFFSWLKSDDGEAIRNRWTEDGPTPCKMIDDKGNEWVELDYEGYGDFGGMDFYELVDTMNGGTGDRMRGIELCDVNHHDPAPDHIKTPRLVSLECTKSWDELPPTKSDPNQGYFNWA